ncbi:hypothetical protein QE152_g6174 [Popillia japonica]|uniref:Uncharacterized protein n=1 Tax=Popillia japonica TaxID=7064 RepID=A0AAW1MJ69_POPJA
MQYVQNFKVHYRGLILKHVHIINSASQLARSNNVLDALYFIKASRDKVEAATIKNCFPKAGFLRDNCILPEFDEEDELLLSTVFNLQNGFAKLNDKNLKEFLNTDEAVHTEDQDIEIELENENDTMGVNDSEDEEDEVIDQAPDSIKPYDEALKQITRLKCG